MRLSRLLPLALLIAGATMTAGVIACGGGGQDKQTAAPSATVGEPTSAATSTATATATATATQTATPTPTPYDGSISRLVYPRLAINAPIEKLGLTSDDGMDTPHRTNTDVGWYCWEAKSTIGPLCDKPGWEGNAVFSAHIYYNNVPAPFQRLQQATTGDEFQVTMDNGAQYKYVVVSRKTYNRDTMPTGQIIWPAERPQGEQWITLISCGGQLDSTGWEYLDRIVVVAKRVA